MDNIGNGLTIAIVGGGFSGAAVAAHLAGHAAFKRGKIVVYEPRNELGRGLAYDTEDNAHRINVPAGRMSLVLDDDNHFLDWLAIQGEVENDPAALAVDGKLYPRRRAFGRYVGDYVQPFVASGVVRHEKRRVSSVRREGEQWLVTGQDHQILRADILVIATSHPAPKAPAGLDRELLGHPRYIADPTVPNCLSVIRPSDRLLVIGAGLTAADVVCSLDQNDHRGPITMFSRRGLRSRGHAIVTQDAFGDFATRPPATAMELLQRVRVAVGDAESQDMTWHAVFDALRVQAGSIWHALPLAEKRRLVRHLRPFWDVHRFRIAPQVDAALTRALKSGRMRLLAAHIDNVERTGETIKAELRRRGTGVIDRGEYDAVVVTTGPAHGGILSSQAWLADLGHAGILKADDTGLGIACDDESRALDSSNHAVPNLFISGPLARGTFGELMGLPQVNEHAVLVANGLARMAEAYDETHRRGRSSTGI